MEGEGGDTDGKTTLEKKSSSCFIPCRGTTATRCRRSVSRIGTDEGLGLGVFQVDVTLHVTSPAPAPVPLPECVLILCGVSMISFSTLLESLSSLTLNGSSFLLELLVLLHLQFQHLLLHRFALF